MAARVCFNSRRYRPFCAGALALTIAVMAAPAASATDRISVDDFLRSYQTNVVEPTECYQVINYLTGWRGAGAIVKTTPQQAIDKLVPDLVVSSNVELNVTTEQAYLQRVEETKTKMAEIWVEKGKDCGAVITKDSGGPQDSSLAHRAPGHVTVKADPRRIGLSGLFFSS